MLTPLPAATPMKPGSAVSVTLILSSSPFLPTKMLPASFHYEGRVGLICSLVFPLHQTFPFFGVVPAILNESGEELEGPCEGYLVRKL